MDIEKYIETLKDGIRNRDWDKITTPPPKDLDYGTLPREQLTEIAELYEIINKLFRERGE